MNLLAGWRVDTRLEQGSWQRLLRKLRRGVLGVKGQSQMEFFLRAAPVVAGSMELVTFDRRLLPVGEAVHIAGGRWLISQIIASLSVYDR
jgi:hypothetical protein